MNKQPKLTWHICPIVFNYQHSMCESKLKLKLRIINTPRLGTSKSSPITAKLQLCFLHGTFDVAEATKLCTCPHSLSPHYAEKGSFTEDMKTKTVLTQILNTVSKYLQLYQHNVRTSCMRQ